MKKCVLETRFYHLREIGEIAFGPHVIEVGEDVSRAIQAGAGFVARKAREDEYLYGVNTGFGSLCETRIEGSQMAALQWNHVVSHACGVGEPVSAEVARLVMFTKLLTFRSGHTGVSLPVVQRLVDFWNSGCIPAIPKRGTVGASGDLAPLAHMALPLLGLGSFLSENGMVPANEVLAQRGWSALVLKPKEGLALTNGVQYINGCALLCVLRILDLVRAADVIAAMSSQAFSCSRTFYDPLYHQTSFHQTRRDVAANMATLLAGSNHFELPGCNRSKQDPYSFRCVPQIHGAVRQLVDMAAVTIENEVNGVSDNPLFFPTDEKVLFGGNLHGQSTAFQLDILAMAMAELSSVSERRTWQLLSGRRELPDFLVPKPGANSGLMIPQYTSAALVNENKVLSNPASVDTIATCQMQEDSVSMGGTSAYKLMQIVDNLEYVLGIELMTAAQATDLLKGVRMSAATKRILEQFRETVRYLSEDRILSYDIELARTFVVRHARAWRDELRLL